MMMTALGLGAAYLMRNKESRNKLKTQFNDFSAYGGNSKSRQTTSGSHGKGGLLTRFFN